MSDLIEKIKKRIEARKWKITDDAFVPEIIGMQYANNMNDWCLEIIDEESAKEPLECNSGLISKKKLIEDINDNLFTVNTQEYGNLDVIDIDNLVDIINNQPQVQPIVRSIDEIADAANMSCPPRYCEHDCGSPEYECKQCWLDWLTEKEVE